MNPPLAYIYLLRLIDIYDGSTRTLAFLSRDAADRRRLLELQDSGGDLKARIDELLIEEHSLPY